MAAAVLLKPDQSADQGMRAARRDPGPPGDQVPGNGTAEGTEDHPWVDDIRSNDAGPDRLGDVQAKEQKRDEVEKGGPEDGVLRA